MAKQKGGKPTQNAKKEKASRSKPPAKLTTATSKGDALKGVKGAAATAKKEDKKSKQFDLHPSVNKHESRDDHHHHDQPRKPSKDDALAEELLSAEAKRKEEHRQHHVDQHREHA